MGSKEKKPGLTRGVAMNARPYPMPGIRVEEDKNDGSITVSVRMKRSKWQKWFGAPHEYERRYRLDGLGREVFDSCRGNISVKQISERLADRYQLNVAESEMAVTTYLKTLMVRGIVGMAIREHWEK